jgi:hypothetical protein
VTDPFHRNNPANQKPLFYKPVHANSQKKLNSDRNSIDKAATTNVNEPAGVLAGRQ